MLVEEQVAGLLSRCEKLLGAELPKIRGDLRAPRAKAAAIWELLVLEAASQLGSIEYEPIRGGSPDIRLLLRHGTSLWLEIAYLYPRFRRQERRTYAVLQWIAQAAEQHGLSPHKLLPCLDGNPNNEAGPVRILPRLDEHKAFLSNPELRAFLADVKAKPDRERHCELSGYTISLSWLPQTSGPRSSWSCLVQESPVAIAQHAVYRVLKKKAKQHTIAGPHVVCLGSDQSPALSSLHAPGRPSRHDAAFRAFAEHRSLSAVLFVSIQVDFPVLGPFRRRAQAELILNPEARFPLSPDDAAVLRTMNFNRWRLARPLGKENPNEDSRERQVVGALTWRPSPFDFKLEVPANALVSALAGKKSLADYFGLPEDHHIVRILDQSWVLKSCKFKEGDIQAGEAPKVVLMLAPPHPKVFSSRRPSTK